MYALTVVLIVVGVLLAILLTIVAFTLWKFFRRERDDDSDSTDFKKDVARMDSISGRFEVPISYKTVQTQLEANEDDDNYFKDRKSRKTSIPSKGARLSVDQTIQGSPVISRKRSEDLSALLPASLYREPLPQTKFDRTQRRISDGALVHLSKQKRRVSAADLRNLSITEEMFKSSLDGRSIVSSLSQVDESDNESATTRLETYTDSATVGIKRRLGESRKTSGVSSGKKSYKKAGKITFTTKYDESTKTLEVHIIRAFELAPKRDSGEINPFAKIYLIPGKTQKQRTKYQKGTKEPFINERFVFLDIDPDELGKYRLKVKIMNYGKLKQNELLGEVDVALSSIDVSCKETFNVDLFKKRSESSLATATVTLCHQATHSKLQVIIKDVSNLPKTGLSGLPNPYVTVSLFREQSIERKNTAKKSNTRDPEFNEALEFDISTDISKPLNTYTLVVTVNHHNLIGSDIVLGHVIFSLTSPQKTACIQWKSTQESPHEHHTKSHSLIDPDEL